MPEGSILLHRFFALSQKLPKWQVLLGRALRMTLYFLFRSNLNTKGLLREIIIA